MEQKNQNLQEREVPKWLLPGGKVDEVCFCAEYYREHYMAYADGSFYSPEGRITDLDALRRDIYKTLRPYLKRGLGAKVESILQTLQLECPNKGLDLRPGDMFVIPTANGSFHLDTQSFSPMKFLTRYRLPVAYNPEAPKPERWLAFLNELLYEEDIPTLQEFMGYCLIPNTLGQKMLILTGKGGEGKSRIGVVMRHLLGDYMSNGSIAKVEGNRFARADLEHQLLMVDDDLQMDALKQTNYLKSLITAEIPMDLEKKGQQSYQGKMYVRFMAFGNDTLQALHDRSNGFFRRQIILTVRERPADRKDDPYLVYGLLKELEGILLWCIEGLERLLIQDYKFTMSRRAKRNLLESMTRSNNIGDFMKSEGYIRPDPEGSIPSRVLYVLYREWCADNALTALSGNSFLSWLNQNVTTYGLQASRTIPIGNGKYARGFLGLRALSRY